MNFLRKIDLIVLFFASLLSISTMSYAGNKQMNMPVASFIGSCCSIVTNDLNFGVYSILSSSDLEAQTTVSVRCTPGQHFGITINEGAGANATVNDRKMTITSGNGATLGYQIYTHPNHNTIWQNIEGVNAQSSVTRKNFKIYGNIVAQQNVPVGNYTDTLTVTLTFW